MIWLCCVVASATRSATFKLGKIMKLKTGGFRVTLVLAVCLMCPSALMASEMKKPLNIVFFGKSGAGKSTLINIFYNHILEKSYSEPRDIVIPLLHMRTKPYLVNVARFKEFNVALNAAGRSQTDAVHSYMVQSKGLPEIQMWDVPGVLDVRGVEKDREHEHLIASALEHVPIHAVVIVLDPKSIVLDSTDLRASINSVRRMLPKNAKANLIGIFNRAQGINKSDRAAYREWFEAAFEIQGQGTAETVYFIEGSNFFDGPEVDDQERADGTTSWRRDGVVVRGLVENMVKMSPVSGSYLFNIQRIVREIENKIAQAQLNEVRTFEQLEKKQTLEESLRLEDSKFDEMVRAIEARFRLKSPVKTGRKRNYRLNSKYTGAGSPYQAIMRAIARYSQELAKCEQVIEGLVLERSLLQSQLHNLRALHAEHAMATDVDPYLDYLRGHLTAGADNSQVSDEVRQHNIKHFEKWIAFYKAFATGFKE